MTLKPQDIVILLKLVAIGETVVVVQFSREGTRHEPVGGTRRP